MSGGRWSRVAHWLASPTSGRRRERVPHWWVHCPICDRGLVGPYNPGGHGLTILRGGAMSLPPNRAELIAKCPVHGRRPYNDPDRRPPVEWVSDDETNP